MALSDSLRLSESRIQGSGLLPVIAHPERSEAVAGDPGLAAGLRERGWLLQMNATSVLGYHGAATELTAWRLLGEGLVETRRGEETRRLFDGSALAGLAARDGVDLAQGG